MSDLTKRWPFGLNRRNWQSYLAFFILVLFVVLFFDAYASREAATWPTVWREPFIFITDFGLSEWVLVPTGVIFLLTFSTFLLWRRTSRWRLALYETALLSGFAFAAVAGTGILTNIFKRLIGRGRPVVYEDVGPFSFQHIFNDWTFQSFPSGHSTTAMATAIVIGFIAPRFFKVFLVIALMTGVSRVVVGDHYPTDVVAGFVVGCLGAYFIRNLFARRGWLFKATLDGHVRSRRLPGLRRLVSGRERSA